MTYDPMVLTFTVAVADLGNGELELTVEKPTDTTFNNALALTSVTATKAWAAPARTALPASVMLTLSRDDGGLISRQTVSAANGWKATWNDLLMYKPDGTLFTYTVTESTVPTGYTTAATLTAPNTFTVTNTLIPVPPPPAPPAPPPDPVYGSNSNNVADSFE